MPILKSMLCEMEINMNIPDGFLEGEIRNSFYVETMMKKTWAAQLKGFKCC